MARNAPSENKHGERFGLWRIHQAAADQQIEPSVIVAERSRSVSRLQSLFASQSWNCSCCLTFDRRPGGVVDPFKAIRSVVSEKVGPPLFVQGLTSFKVIDGVPSKTPVVQNW